MGMDTQQQLKKPPGKPLRRASRRNVTRALTVEHFGDAKLPGILKQGRPAIDVFRWLDANKQVIDKKLIEHGAILFRGFKLGSPAQVERFSSLTMQSVHKSNVEHRPVDESGVVQVPVEYPSRKFLLWHNENTFNYSWPQKAIFACEQPARVGGQTPLVDSRVIFQKIPAAIRQTFIDKGVMYVRRYGSENTIGLSWKTIFKTDKKSEVERQCIEQHMEFEWEDGNTLVTKAKRPAVWQHPTSGDWSWINQAQHFHFSCLSDEAQLALTKLHPDGRFPRDCFYGDGTKISAEVMRHILALYQKNQIIFDWQPGDLVLVDNILAAHARSPFEGERKILVCFGDLTHFHNISVTSEQV